MAKRMNARGRPYTNGKAISDDLRELIVSALIENGADKETGKAPRGIFTKVSMQFKVSDSGVTNIWKKNCEDGNVSRRPGGVKPRKLSDGDIGLIQTIISTTPSISYQKNFGRVGEIFCNRSRPRTAYRKSSPKISSIGRKYQENYYAPKQKSLYR